MSLPSLVLFDCDGVLIDSENLSLQALVEVLEQVHGIKMPFDDAMDAFMGKSQAFEVSFIKEHYGIDLSQDYIDKKFVRRTELYETSLQPIPGIADLLDALPTKKCVASSSSPERLQHSLSLTGLIDRFAPNIFSTTMVKNGKPAPDLFLYAAEKMGADPASCLVIEDSPAGVQAGKAAGMTVYGFTGGSHIRPGHDKKLLDLGADKLFASMADLKTFFAREAAYGV